MSCPMMHDIPVGGLIPIMKRNMDYKASNLEFKDYFPEKFKRFGIIRAEMLVIMNAAMTVDVLSGTDKLHYIGEVDGEQ